MRTEGIQPNVITYSTLIEKAPDYDIAKGWVEMMPESIQPNVITYNTLINKAPDYDIAKGWVETMRTEGIQPDVITYNTLIKKALDYDVAKGWLETIRAEGILPTFVTYNALIKKSPDYGVARGWVETMRVGGFQPNDVTYSTLFSKDLSGKLADDILKWYLAQKYHPEKPIQAAIATYRKIGRIDQVLRLVLDYPHLQSARRIIQEHSDEALQYFKKIFDDAPQHPNAAYALGVAYLELGKEQEAQSYLSEALKLATALPRKSVIKEWLRQIDHKQSQK
jgi:tetratricopeptide (TPR) repeat protein